MPQVDEAQEKKIRLLVGRIQNLPTPPIVFSQITRVINDPDTSAYDIAKIIAEDPALTAKILKLTNSSFYGIPRTITNVKQAIVILGMEAVKSLVISASVFEMFAGKKSIDVEYLSEFWKHSLKAALMARIICRVTEFPSILEAEISFSAGLLHDIGKLVIMSHLPDDHRIIKDMLNKDGDFTAFEVETTVLQFNHADLGSFLASKWNLPESLCAAIKFHHDIEAVCAQPEAALIHLADYLAHHSSPDDVEVEHKKTLFNEAVWKLLGLKPTQLEKLLGLLNDEFSRAETFMKMAQGLE
jgi:putative nucleotidyltransferase with HDIG domain